MKRMQISLVHALATLAREFTRSDAAQDDRARRRCQPGALGVGRLRSFRLQNTAAPGEHGQAGQER